VNLRVIVDDQNFACAHCFTTGKVRKNSDPCFGSFSTQILLPCA
jgi:hypothetical protein